MQAPMLKALHPPLRYLTEQRVVNGISGAGYVANKEVQTEIDQLDSITAIELRVTGEIATGGAPGAPVPRPGAPAKLLGNIRFNVNGQDEINAPAELLDPMGQQDMGALVIERDFPTAGQLAVAAATLPFALTLRIPLCMRRIDEEHYNLLSARLYDQLTLFYVYGLISDLVDSPGTCTVVAATTSTEVALIRTRPQKTADEGYGSFIRRAKPVDVTSPQLGFTTRLESGRGYKGIAMLATAGATNTRSDGVITGMVEIRRGGKVERRVPVAKLISDNAAQLPAGFDRTGFYFLEFVDDGRDVRPSLGKALYVPKNESLEVLLDVSTPGVNSRVTFVPVIIQPVQDTANARGRPVPRG